MQTLTIVDHHVQDYFMNNGYGAHALKLNDDDETPPNQSTENELHREYWAYNIFMLQLAIYQNRLSSRTSNRPFGTSLLTA